MKIIAIGIAALATLIGTAVVASAQSQSTEDILRRLQAIEASNAALAKETAALRQRVTTLSEENAKLRDRVGEPKGSNHAAAAQQGSTTSASAVRRTDPKIALYDKASSPMVVKGPPLPPTPIWNWSGFYLGGHLGVGISRDDWSADQVDWFNAISIANHPIGVVPLTDAGSHNDVGLLGGFQAGYNWQFPSTPIVVGIEGEWSFADLQGNHSNTTPFAGSHFGGAGLFTGVGTEASRFSTKVEDIATIAGRFGVTSGPQDRTLWYVKGGAAWVRDSFAETTHVTGEFTEASPSPVIGQFNGSGSVRHDRWGWVVGTGVELGLIGNWSAKIEYEFLDFGTMNFTMPITGQFGATCPACFILEPGSFNRNFSVKQEINVIKVGLNYRFNGWNY